jgi:hypothetical protein
MSGIGDVGSGSIYALPRKLNVQVNSETTSR